MDEERVSDLVMRWDDLRKEQQEVSPEQLCQDCPELLEEVRRQIDALKSMAWLEASGGVGDGPPQPRALIHRTLGKFELTALLGEGGFGEVWKAHDPVLKRDVAIKIPHSERMPSFEQFVEEACKVARLPRHSGIVQVFDAGKDGETYYIVSAYIEGPTLADRIRAGDIDIPTALRWVAQVADALHYAHTEKIIHRDIKPSNILLGQDGNPTITDFGIAINEDAFKDGLRASLSGTLVYMSPERLAGKPADRRTDIYSLGVVLYELLTGQLPFDAPSPFDIQKAILEGKPKPPSQINDKIPERVERICFKAMALDPSNRYSTAKSLADDLRSYLQPRRHWVWLAVAVSSVMLILTLMAGRWIWNAKTEARESKERALQQASKAQSELRSVTTNVEKTLKQASRARAEVRSIITDIERMPGEPRPQIPSSDGAAAKPEFSDPMKDFQPLLFAGSTIDLSGHELTEEDFDQLGAHILLRRLILADTTTTDAQLTRLRSIVVLEGLDLAGTKVTDAGIKELVSFSALRDLSLARTGISDVGLSRVGQLRLRTLDLSDTKITDGGINSLANKYGCGASLTELNLAGTGIGDASVSYLKSMPRMTRLVLTGTQVTHKGAEQIHDALPKCKIER